MAEPTVVSCRFCHTVLDKAIAHCTSRTCNWCRACWKKRGGRA